MAEFVFDGCTGFFDKILGVDLTQCCLEHDINFWTRQGPDGKEIDFISSNLQMLECFYHQDPIIGGIAAAVAGLGIFTGGLIFWRRGKRGNRDGIHGV